MTLFPRLRACAATLYRVPLRAALLAAGLVVTGPALGVEFIQAQQFQLTEAQFDSWITNGRGGAPLALAEAQLTGRIEQLDRVCHLTADQRTKLELAGRGDLARFQSDMGELRAKLIGKNYDQNEINEVYGQIQPLARRIQQGLLDEGSLFLKVKGNILDAEQVAACQRAEADRIAFQYQAKVKLFVAALDETAPMLDKQREKLLALLLSSTRPPRRWGGEQHDWWYVLLQAGRVPERELSAVLDDAQTRCFYQVVGRAAPYAPTLKSLGIVPMGEEGDAAAAPAPQAPAPALIFQFR